MNVKKRSAVFIIFASVILLMFYSCDPGKKYEKEEAAAIQDYLSINSNLNFVLKPSGLYYLEVEEGTGPQPITSDTAWVKYTGKFLDGRVFDTNVGTTDSLGFPVYEGWLIYGFDEGILYMKEGGKATLLIPSSLAYGSAGKSIIPGYTPLLFDIELLHVIPGPGPAVK